ncbi:MAG: lantibiotic dehydratase [Saprospiraceae bacterium]|nr:lantibiotic dehydratase [Saprospiraceae bacterium]
MLPLTLIRTAGLPLRALSPLADDFSGLLSRLDAAAQGLLAAGAEVQQAFDETLGLLPEGKLRTTVYNARRLFFQKQKLAKPLPDGLPPTLYTTAEQWLAAQQALNEARAIFREQYDRALQTSLAELSQQARSEPLQRSLLMSSHELLSALPGLTAQPAGFFNKKQRQLAFTLLQYLTRAAVKTSPFSRLTTLSRLSGGDTAPDDDAPPGWSNLKALATPNVALLPLLYEVLLKAPSFYRALSLRCNPALHTDEHGRYKWLYFDGEQESFQQMPATPLLRAVVEYWAQGQGLRSFREALSFLESILDAAPEAREKFLIDLTDLGFLEWQWPERGLTASWCSGLYQFLGFLPHAEPLVVEAAALLQWLRTAARVLPHQPVDEARQTQHDTAEQLRLFFDRYHTPLPAIPPEHLFYEDVEDAVQVDIPTEAVQGLIDDLANCWRQKKRHLQSDRKAAMWAFAQESANGPVDFCDFTEAFLRSEGYPGAALNAPRFEGKIGALLQIFSENGQWRAVVNGLFPGGGKLAARWLHLFPTDVKNQLAAWWPADTLAFPWQGWNNANFQPDLSSGALLVPGGRSNGTHHIPLHQLAVAADESDIYLLDKNTGQRVRFSDLGLEAPDARPPVMQLLWHLGMPRVSRDLLLPEEGHWQQIDTALRRRPRIVFGALVLARACWEIRLDAIPADPAEGFLYLRKTMADYGVPRLFFARFPNEKPRYFDQDSPLLMQLLVRKIAQHGPLLYVEEMLPLPEQAVAGAGEDRRASEFVVEFEV